MPRPMIGNRNFPGTITLFPPGLARRRESMAGEKMLNFYDKLHGARILGRFSFWRSTYPLDTCVPRKMHILCHWRWNEASISTNWINVCWPSFLLSILGESTGIAVFLLLTKYFRWLTIGLNPRNSWSKRNLGHQIPTGKRPSAICQPGAPCSYGILVGERNETNQRGLVG